MPLPPRRQQQQIGCFSDTTVCPSPCFTLLTKLRKETKGQTNENQNCETVSSGDPVLFARHEQFGRRSEEEES